MNIDYKRACVSGCVGSVCLTFFLVWLHVHDYLIAVCWANFIIANYFYYRLEFLFFRLMGIVMIERHEAAKRR